MESLLKWQFSQNIQGVLEMWTLRKWLVLKKKKNKFKLTISSDDTVSHKAMELPVPSEENQETNSMVTWLSFSVRVQVRENPNEEEINQPDLQIKLWIHHS